MIAKSGDKIFPPCISKCTSASYLEIQRLTAWHFIQKIIVDRQKTRICRSCKVCVSNEREEDKWNGPERNPPGYENSYECRDCGVTVCVNPCFYIYHNYRLHGEVYRNEKTVVICFFWRYFFCFHKEMTVVLVSCVTYIFVIKIFYTKCYSHCSNTLTWLYCILFLFCF